MYTALTYAPHKNYLVSLRNVFFFWVHAGLMAWYFVAGFFYGLETIVIALLLIQLHLLIFGGCVITQIQHHYYAIPRDEEFVPYFFRRVFRVQLAPEVGKVVFYVLLTFPLLVAVIRE